MNNSKNFLPIVLSIAGSDSCAGAGIQADLKTCAALKTYACTAITAVTSQNRQGVSSIEVLSPSMVIDQCKSILSDFKVECIKIGMLGNIAIIKAVAKLLSELNWSIPVVLDPVMVSTTGANLLEPEAIYELKKLLIPNVNIITPNISEAVLLLNKPIPSNRSDMLQLLKDLKLLESKAVLLKGGHLSKEAKSTDFFFDGNEILVLDVARIKTDNTHGTGCTLSTAIAAFIARGNSMRESIIEAKKYVHRCIFYSDKLLKEPKSNGPIHHFIDLYNN